jgi:hypothetical protein
VTTNADPITRGLELPLYSKNIVLSCNNTNDKKVDHWEKEGTELLPGDLKELGLDVAEDKSSLTIGSARRHHEGNYSCVFDSERGDFIVKGQSHICRR